MRRALIIGILLCFFTVVILTPAPVSAHAPNSIHLSYDFNMQVLTVTIEHDGSGTHYINLIEIWKNEIPDTSKNYDSQTNSSHHVDTFDIEASHGDVLRAKATCNQVGYMEDQITIGVSDTSMITTLESTTGSDGVILGLVGAIMGVSIIVVLIILVWMNKK